MKSLIFALRNIPVFNSLLIFYMITGSSSKTENMEGCESVSFPSSSSICAYPLYSS